MNSAIYNFSKLIKEIELSEGLFSYIEKQRIPLDASDLLRWEWVFSVSALDKYIHDIVRIGMVQQFKSIRPHTKKYETFKIEIGKIVDYSNPIESYLAFENEIIQQHKHLAFQAPDKISDALSFIWSEDHKWKAISDNIGYSTDERSVKLKLNNIVMRRNQIVHEGDCISMSPFRRQPLEHTDVLDVVNFITILVNTIHGLIG